MAARGMGKSPVCPGFEAGVFVFGRWGRWGSLESLLRAWVGVVLLDSDNWGFLSPLKGLVLVISRARAVKERRTRKPKEPRYSRDRHLSLSIILQPLSPHFLATLCRPPHSPHIPGRPVSSASWWGVFTFALGIPWRWSRKYGGCMWDNRVGKPGSTRDLAAFQLARPTLLFYTLTSSEFHLNKCSMAQVEFENSSSSLNLGGSHSAWLSLIMSLGLGKISRLWSHWTAHGHVCAGTTRGHGLFQSGTSPHGKKTGSGLWTPPGVDKVWKAILNQRGVVHGGRCDWCVQATCLL